jgi:predicted AAA+ superfamily ATPase
MVGRITERQEMLELLVSNKAEMLAMYGRRRVGKTFLIKNVYKDHIAFEFTGTQHASLQNQLFKFKEKIITHFGESANSKDIKSWYDAFEALKNGMKTNVDKKQVIFFDELPWICGNRNTFINELSYWWNDWAAYQNIVVVLCGSAASWMVQKVLNHKGGLHNRVTKRINLHPFTLAESKLFLESQEVKWDHYQVIQFYMAVGGIPIYLQEAKKNETVTQTIDRIFFTKDSFMRTEYNNLYAALFNNYQNHVDVIKTLAEKWSGMTRQEVIAKTKFKDGGGLTKVLEELETASFIIATPSYKKHKKDIVYRLADEYSLFYLKFIDNKTTLGKNEWLKHFGSAKYKIWSGYAFENLCIKHAEAIKMALGISGIHTETSCFIFRADAENDGFQIDLLINRADQAMNLCEIKFYSDDFRMTDEYADKLRSRREQFRYLTKTKKQLFNTIITTFGIKHSPASLGQIDQVITMDKLFTIEKF